ncbi:hypothetical protein [Sulfurimonas autotrophica]|uniref:CotH protein n=1 Tax=Sulfurimonas autotrophica (strain ATCC BAA-671 / DSM 16294 / JCM 11897 / OK10) TaxID=563040 RepID=E0UQL7_SULAO|nr:hypothetical protein [Sulfurimonas autotrophica]ADN09889.1 hypothetical protein Saut_1845 [Sulfurimonas autotrophica DSM 16294]
MKKNLATVLTLVLFTSILIAKTVTDINLSNAPYTEGMTENTYGDKIMYQDVTINTKDFKINNFWGKFSDTAQDQSNFTDIATWAKIKLTTENSFTCKDGGLLSNGCSGQKPFLLNENTLGNPALQLDKLGAPLGEGEYRIPFDSAANYDPSHDDAFYALDVFRDAQYYKEPAAGDTVNSTKQKNFFGYVVGFFQDYFSKDTAVYGSAIGSPEARDRYMANMIFGLQKEYRIVKEDPITTTQTNQANANKKVTLLDYNSLIVEETTGCDGLFFSYDPDSLTCKSINFFGISQWMPFINSTDSSAELSVQSDSVLEDTETTLLTLAGKLDNVNYIDLKTKIDPSTGKKTFIQEVFKPMSYMMGSMFRFFFGENSKNLTEVVSADFDFVHHMPLTFIKTDGTKALDFVYFELLGLESVYGTEVESCRVKKSGFIFTWDEKTFTQGIATNTEFDMEAGLFGWINNPSEYSELNTTTETHFYWFPNTTHDIVNLSTDDWLDWCKRNQGRQKKGLLGRFIDTFVSFVLGDNRSTTYDEQIDNLLKDENWEVVEYKEKVHKGLILHLKKVDITDINSSTPGTTTEFKIMKMTRGHQK